MKWGRSTVLHVRARTGIRLCNTKGTICTFRIPTSTTMPTMPSPRACRMVTAYLLYTRLGRWTDGVALPVLDLERTSTAIDLYLQAGPPWPSSQWYWKVLLIYRWPDSFNRRSSIMTSDLLWYGKLVMASRSWLPGQRVPTKNLRYSGTIQMALQRHASRTLARYHASSTQVLAMRYQAGKYQVPINLVRTWSWFPNLLNFAISK